MPISEFGINRTNRAGLTMSVVRGKAEVASLGCEVAFDPTRTSANIAANDISCPPRKAKPRAEFRRSASQFPLPSSRIFIQSPATYARWVDRLKVIEKRTPLERNSVDVSAERFVAKFAISFVPKPRRIGV